MKQTRHWRTGIETAQTKYAVTLLKILRRPILKENKSDLGGFCRESKVEDFVTHNGETILSQPFIKPKERSLIMSF